MCKLYITPGKYNNIMYHSMDTLYLTHHACMHNYNTYSVKV